MQRRLSAAKVVCNESLDPDDIRCRKSIQLGPKKAVGQTETTTTAPVESARVPAVLVPSQPKLRCLRAFASEERERRSIRHPRPKRFARDCRTRSSCINVQKLNFVKIRPQRINIQRLVQAKVVLARSSFRITLFILLALAACKSQTCIIVEMYFLSELAFSSSLLAGQVPAEEGCPGEHVFETSVPGLIPPRLRRRERPACEEAEPNWTFAGADTGCEPGDEKCTEAPATAGQFLLCCPPDNAGRPSSENAARRLSGRLGA